MIFERTGKVHKSHGGVHSEFNRLAREEGALVQALSASLIQAYDYKTLADYETGSRSDVTPQRATVAIVSAEQFVAVITKLVSP